MEQVKTLKSHQVKHSWKIFLSVLFCFFFTVIGSPSQIAEAKEVEGYEELDSTWTRSEGESAVGNYNSCLRNAKGICYDREAAEDINSGYGINDAYVSIRYASKDRAYAPEVRSECWVRYYYRVPVYDEDDKGNRTFKYYRDSGSACADSRSYIAHKYHANKSTGVDAGSEKSSSIAKVGEKINFWHWQVSGWTKPSQSKAIDATLFAWTWGFEDTARVPRVQGDTGDGLSNRVYPQANLNDGIWHGGVGNSKGSTNLAEYNSHPSGYLSFGPSLPTSGKYVYWDRFPRITKDMMGYEFCQNLSHWLNGHVAFNGAPESVHNYKDVPYYAGSNIRRETYTPGSDWIWTNTNPACVYVPYVYQLDSCVSSPKVSCESWDRDIPLSPGETVELTPKITKNNDNPTKKHEWRVTAWEVNGAYESSKTPVGVSDTKGDNICSTYASAFRVNLEKCRTIRSGKDKMEKWNYTQSSIFEDIRSQMDNGEVGRRYCFALSVKSYSMKDNEDWSRQYHNDDWKNSKPTCILIVKHPKFQVWSNGIYAKGGVQARHTTLSNGSVYGSWAEFEALSNSKIFGFGTGSDTTRHNLTFRNNGTRGYYGEWGTRLTADKLAKNIQLHYAKSDASRNVQVIGDRKTNLTYGGYDDSRSGEQGKIRVIYAKNLHLTGNIINRDPSGTDIHTFQQTMIVADNVIIDNNVSRVDAWIVADNYLLTCSLGKGANFTFSDINVVNLRSQVTQSTCGNYLKFNAPVVVGKIELWRTAGADGSRRAWGEPAEVFSERADTYLWHYYRTIRDSHLRTTYTKELPVRY